MERSRFPPSSVRVESKALIAEGDGQWDLGMLRGFVYHWGFVGLKNDLHQVKKQLLISGGSCKIIFSSPPQSELL